MGEFDFKLLDKKYIPILKNMLYIKMFISDKSFFIKVINFKFF